MTVAERFREDGMKQGQVVVTINCLQEGAHIQFIAKVTGLSVDEVKRIAKENGFNG